MARFFGLLFLVGALAACGSKGHEPFAVQPELLVGQIHRLALSPVAAPEELAINEQELGRLQLIIVKQLDSAGFAVVGPDRVSDIWDPILDEVGGFYDPRSGRVIEEKRMTATSRFANELRERHAVDAIVYPELLLVEAPYAEGNARWDGTSQSVAGFWAKFANALSAVGDIIADQPHVSTLPVGTVTAVTLQIVIEDLNGNALYTNWGGVEVVADDKTGEWLDPSTTFKDSDRFEKAVEIAVKEFVKKIGQS